MIIRRVLGGLMLPLSLLLSNAAHADEWRDGSVQVLCQPEKGYFELQTRQNFTSTAAQLESMNVFFPHQLEKSPFICRLANRTVRVEGANGVDGRGPCGAREGAKVRVSIDDVPVKYSFESSNGHSSVHGLSKGWIETSDCFERQHTITIRQSLTANDWLLVELCRIENSDDRRRDGLIDVRGACKTWWTNDDPFPRPTASGDEAD